MAGSNKIFICPSCGGRVEWSPSAGNIVCPYCGSVYAPDFFEKQEEQLAQELDQQQYAKGEEASAYGYESAEEATDDSAGTPDDLVIYQCSSCGAQIITDKTTVATNCAFCGSPVVLTQQLDTAFRPKWILPFRVDKAKVDQIYWDYVKSRPFTPAQFRARSQVEKIKSVYLPFWLYDIDMQGSLSARGEQLLTSADKHFVYTTHQIYDLQRAGTLTLTRIPVDASRQTPDDAMDSIEPFDLNELQPFRTAYMAGFMAERYDQDEKECYPRAMNRAVNTMRGILHRSIGTFASVQILSEDISELNRGSGGRAETQTEETSGVRADYALLPVYLLFTKYNGKDYLFAVNGQTGKAVGDVPAAGSRALLFFLICFAVLTGILYAAGVLFF